MKFYTRFELNGLHPEHALIRLKRMGIIAIEVEKKEKDCLFFTVDQKEEKKVFAIFQDSCYNIKKSRLIGFAALVATFKKRVGIFIGLLLSCFILIGTQGYVFKIQVYGSGIRYTEKVLEILEQNEIKIFSRYPNSVELVNSTILTLPNVSFCSIRKDGYIVWVEVETNQTDFGMKGMDFCADCTGIVKSVLVLRGQCVVSVGDAVFFGDKLVKACDNSGNSVSVVAKIEVECQMVGTISEILLETQGDYLLLYSQGDLLTVSYIKKCVINF